MALPSSGAISLNQVNVEIGNSATATISMNDADVRTLFDDASGEISMSQGYGKSWYTPMVATGGTITTSGDYKIHVFNSSGTFNITTLGDDAVVQYLVVAGGGGGGGGSAGGGGGGAGGYRTASNFSVSQQGYSITVGGGGVGTTSPDNNNAVAGSNSVFSSITSTGGGYGSGTGPAPHYRGDGGSGGSGGGGLSLIHISEPTRPY